MRRPGEGTKWIGGMEGETKGAGLDGSYPLVFCLRVDSCRL